MHEFLKQLADIIFALLGAAMIGASVIFLDGYVQFKKPRLPIDVENAEEYEK